MKILISPAVNASCLENTPQMEAFSYNIVTSFLKNIEINVFKRKIFLLT